MTPCLPTSRQNHPISVSNPKRPTQCLPQPVKRTQKTKTSPGTGHATRRRADRTSIAARLHQDILSVTETEEVADILTSDDLEPISLATMIKTVSSIQGAPSPVPEPPESSSSTSDDKLQEFIGALETPPEAMTVRHQIVEFLQENMREVQQLRKDMGDVKRRLSRLNLSSYVSTHPPKGHTDLTPCLEPQAIAPAPAATKPSTSEEPEPNSTKAPLKAFFTSYRL